MNQIPLTHIYPYLLSGKCHATFHNTLTNKQLHVYIRQKTIGIWYVYHNKQYLGYLRGDVFINMSGEEGRLASQQFSWVWKQVVAGTLPETLHVLHDGCCGHCGRPLTDAISLKYGLGKVCRDKLGIQVTKLEEVDNF